MSVLLQPFCTFVHDHQIDPVIIFYMVWAMKTWINKSQPIDIIRVAESLK